MKNLKKSFVILTCIVVALTSAKLPENGSAIGIDVSHHQKTIDWSKVKTWNGHPIQFVYVKATEGATYQDNTYKYNFYEAKKHGNKVGSYHYFRTSSSVEDQFNNLIRNVKKSDQDLIPLIDVEEKRNWDSKTFHKNLKKFLVMVEKHYGKKPMIYCVNSFYNRHLSYGYKDYRFMVGRYGKNSPNMKRGAWTIWQFSESGKIDGIKKSVDIDRFQRNIKLKNILL